ncbi:hypothetical protein [Undibacterium sp. Di24W]|uniref:hypothetical protein n=1 Tax=Undibacterium sp. Di24W TaxID=3413033 RepID=UPI003BEFF7BE
MTFVLEEISSSDHEKYQLTDKNPFTYNSVQSNEWLIDRERNMYFRKLGGRRRDDPYVMEFHCFWRGVLLAICFDCRLEHITPRDVKVKWAYGGGDPLPENLRPYVDEFYADLKEALTLYKSEGISSPFDSYVVEFDF